MNREEMKEMNVKELATLFAAYKDQLADLKDTASSLQKEFDILRKEILPEKMDETGFDNVKVTGIGRISLRPELYASIVADKKAEALEWLAESGFGDIIKPTVNASTFKAFCKEQILEGTELPDELFSVTPYTMATLTKT